VRDPVDIIIIGGGTAGLDRRHLSRRLGPPFAPSGVSRGGRQHAAVSVLLAWVPTDAATTTPKAKTAPSERTVLN
jgi:hypothetical protein